MKKSDFDAKYLTRGMLLPACALAVSIMLVVVSYFVKEQVDFRLGEAQSRFGSAQQLRNERQSKELAYSEYSASYDRLRRRGAIGTEDRLERIELLRTTAKQLRLPYLRYTIAPQKIFEAPYLMVGMSNPVFNSPVELQIGLAHEMDLLRFFNLLEAGPGVFHVKRCALARVTPPNQLSATTPNLTGECTVDWLSIAPGQPDPMLVADSTGEF